MSHNWSACAKHVMPASLEPALVPTFPFHENRLSSWIQQLRLRCSEYCGWKMNEHDVKWCWWSWIAVIDTLTLPASTAKMLDCFDGDYPDPLCVNTAEDSLSLRCVAAAMHGRLCFCFTVMHCPISSDNWFKAGIVETGMTRRGVCVWYIYIYICIVYILCSIHTYYTCVHLHIYVHIYKHYTTYIIYINNIHYICTRHCVTLRYVASCYVTSYIHTYIHHIYYMHQMHYMQYIHDIHYIRCIHYIHYMQYIH